MSDWLFELLRGHFVDHGYITIFCALLLENAGIPVPGETILLFASFLAYENHQLSVPLIILVASCAGTLGDNIGYWIGHRGGRPLLERYQHVFRISNATIRRGEKLFENYGSVTIFFARFVFGMRIIAGPLAGVLRMEWRRFALFNMLGAIVWATVITAVGYFFGRQWRTMLEVMGRVNFVIFIVAAVVAWMAWKRFRASKQDEE